jgi:hypothetical protein
MSNEVKTRPVLEGLRPPLTIDELMILTRKSRPWIYKRMAEGLIKFFYNGDTRLTPAEEGDRIAREGVGPLRAADASPHGRYRFPRKRANPNSEVAA